MRRVFNETADRATSGGERLWCEAHWVTAFQVETLLLR